MKILFICGPWGSGTSVATHILLTLGAVGVPPYFKTNDPKTGSSFESQPFKALLRSFAEPQTFSLTKSRPEVLGSLNVFKEQLRLGAQNSPVPAAGRPIVLKHPLCCLILGELDEVFDCSFIFVRRSLTDIEAGRIRRGWPAFFGSDGASKCYSRINRFLKDGRGNTLALEYEDLLRAPAETIATIAKFSQLSVSEMQLRSAMDLVSQHPNSKH